VSGQGGGGAGGRGGEVLDMQPLSVLGVAFPAVHLSMSTLHTALTHLSCVPCPRALSGMTP
jgi:hypothetical protein